MLWGFLLRRRGGYFYDSSALGLSPGNIIPRMSSRRFMASRGDCRLATLLVFCYDYCWSLIAIDMDMLPLGVDD